MGVKQIKSRCTTGSNETDVEKLLTEQPISYPLKHYSNTAPAGDPDLTVAFGTTWVNTVTADGATKGKRRESLELLILERTLKGGMQDMMTQFWMNHFGVDFGTVIEPNFCWQYYSALWNGAFGNFKKLVRDIGLNSAMLVRLNGEVNSKNEPNENYAREKVELFTLGLGNYTENDVALMAKSFSGMYHSYNSTVTSQVSMDPKNHDNTDKQYSSFFANTTIKGSGTPFVEYDAVVDMIFRTQPQTVAKFICRKLYRWFINYEIDANFVSQMADTLITYNWELKPVLRFMLNSTHFHDPKFSGCILKSPIEMVANVVRDFKMTIPADVDSRYRTLYKLYVPLLPLQIVGNPPSIAGWDAYRQSPEWDKLWFNSSTGVVRDTILVNMLDQWKYTYNGQGFWVDVIGFTKKLSNPADPNALVNEVLDILWYPFTAEDKQRIKKDTLLSGQAEDRYWTNAWNAYLLNPDAANTSVVTTRLTSLYRYIITHETYQLK